ncbi:MAG: hypothetical protein ACSHYF_16045 [Verrucomicrobiaceae bacterium]
MKTALLFLLAATLGWLLTNPGTHSTTGDPTATLPRSTGTRTQATSRHDDPRIREARKVTSYQDRVRHFIALISTIPVSEIPALHRSQSFTGLDPELENLFWSITSERWLAEDPRAFMTWATRLNYNRASTYFAHWTATDPSAATTFAKTLSPNEAHSLLAAAIKQNGKTNPDLAFQIATHHLDFLNLNSYQTRNILSTLANLDPTRFLALRDQLPPSIHNDLLHAHTASTLKSDFTGAISSLLDAGLGFRDLIDSSRYLDHREDFVALLSQHRHQLPQGWFKELLTTKPHLLNNAAGLKLLMDNPSALPLDESELQRLHSRLTQNYYDTKAAPELRQLLNGNFLPTNQKEKLLKTLLRHWNDNPTLLNSLLAGITDPNLQSLTTAVESIAAEANVYTTPKAPDLTDSASFISYLKERSGGYQRIPKWTPSEQAAAIVTYDQLPQSERLQIAANFSAISTDKTDFLRHILLDQANSPFPEANWPKPTIYSNFASTWAKSHPAKAAAFVEQLPPGDTRTQSAAVVVSRWNNYAPEEAQQWISTLPAADQQAIRTFLEEK